MSAEPILKDAGFNYVDLLLTCHLTLLFSCKTNLKTSTYSSVLNNHKKKISSDTHYEKNIKSILTIKFYLLIFCCQVCSKTFMLISCKSSYSMKKFRLTIKLNIKKI